MSLDESDSGDHPNPSKQKFLSIIVDIDKPQKIPLRNDKSGTKTNTPVSGRRSSRVSPVPFADDEEFKGDQHLPHNMVLAQRIINHVDTPSHSEKDPSQNEEENPNTVKDEEEHVSQEEQAFSSFLGSDEESDSY